MWRGRDAYAPIAYKQVAKLLTLNAPSQDAPDCSSAYVWSRENLMMARVTVSAIGLRYAARLGKYGLVERPVGWRTPPNAGVEVFGMSADAAATGQSISSRPPSWWLSMSSSGISAGFCQRDD
jgi:hypothetical protein